MDIRSVEPFDPEQVEKAVGGVYRFTMRGSPVLQQGAWTRGLAVADNLWVHGKVYAEGGENALHQHLEEDHGFFVIEGGATFSLEDGSTIEVGPYDGIMIPKGAFYRFEAKPGQNLVFIRFGGGPAGLEMAMATAPASRNYADGTKFEAVGPRDGAHGQDLIVTGRRWTETAPDGI